MDKLEKFFTLWKYILLGFVQGFTEPIPISSSGHVFLLKEWLNIDIHGLSFEVIVNFGSFIAICIVYQKDIYRLFMNSLFYLVSKQKTKRNDFHFTAMIFWATLPTALIGLFLKDMITDHLISLRLVGGTLILTGIFLWIIRHKKGWKEGKDITRKDAIMIGIAQTIALLPGISRSGATIVAAMLLGFNREIALRFSFMLYIPVSVGAMLLSLFDFSDHLEGVMIPLIIACIIALLATYYSLRWFIHVMKKGNLKYFTYYCLGLGGFIFLIY